MTGMSSSSPSWSEVGRKEPGRYVFFSARGKDSNNSIHVTINALSIMGQGGNVR